MKFDLRIRVAIVVVLTTQASSTVNKNSVLVVYEVFEK